MGKIINGILGGVSGKVGGVVGANWKGIPTVRAYAIPSNPNSTGQQTQRTLFTAVLAFLKLLTSTVLQPYWDPFVSNMSGFNKAMSVNLLAWSDDTAFDDAIISQGSLELSEITSATYATASGDTYIFWDSTIMGNGLATDIACGVIVDTENNIAFVSDTVARNEDSINMDIGAGRTVGNLKAYLFFHRGSGEELVVSNSSYSQPAAP